jgi:hypothetical protein
MAALEDAHGGEEADSGAEAGAADFELAGEFALRRKTVAWFDLTGGDEGADVLDDLHGELAVRGYVVVQFVGSLFFHAVNTPARIAKRVTRSAEEMRVRLALSCAR